MAVAFPLAWFTLMDAPAVALLVRLRGSARTIAPRAAIVLALVALAWFLSIEFAWRPLNWVALAGAYVGWAMLVGAAFAVRPRPIGVVLGVAGVVTLLPGLFLGTVGVLGLALVLEDYVDAPARAVTVEPGLDCVVTNWGNVTSDDGHDVHLYRYLTWFPILRLQVRRVVVDETNPTSGRPASTGCRDVTSGRA